MEAPGFWDDTDRSQKLMKELKGLKSDVETCRHLEQTYDDIQTMIEMGYEENDESLIPEIQEMMDDFSSNLDKIRIKTLLSGIRDSSFSSRCV